MNKLLVAFLVVCISAVSMATLKYHTGYKTHLGGAGYGYHSAGYASHGYRKPVLHHSPVVYAHKYDSKPHVTHYVKPSYHHTPYVAAYHSKPVHYLGGHVSHGIAYKPAYSHGVHGHGHGVAYAAKSYHHH